MAQWKYIPGYEGIYSVSDDGRVLSHSRTISDGRIKYNSKDRILKPGKRERKNLKYEFVVLLKDEKEKHFSVHRLVATAFLDNPMNLPEVNHKDENTLNNNVNNLEWCTRQYNIEYSKSKRVSQFSLDGEKIAEYKSIKHASDITKIKRTAISNALIGWSKTAGHYIWKYETEE